MNESNVTNINEKRNENRFFKRGKRGAELFQPHLLSNEILNEIPIHYTNAGFFFYQKGLYTRKSEALLRKIIRTKLDTKANIQYVRETVASIADLQYIDESQLNIYNCEIINVKNGLLNIETGELLPHDKEYKSTIQLPIVYNPAADCPNIKKFFSEIVEKDTIPLLEEWFAYTMFPTAKHQKAMMLVGGGANGKSILISLYNAFIGKDNISNTDLQTFEKRFATSDIFGKLANTSADLPASALKDTGIFKKIVVGDAIRAEFKNKDAFMFNPFARLMFSTNELPPSLDVTEGFYRRWLIVNFPNQFKGKNADPNLLDKLTTEEELSGLLNLCIEAWKRLEEQGEFSENQFTKTSLEEYRLMNDKVAQFIKEECDVIENTRITKNDFYRAYKYWCDDSNYKALGRNKFYNHVEQKGFMDRKMSGTRFFVGLKIRNTSDFKNYNYEYPDFDPRYIDHLKNNNEC